MEGLIIGIYDKKTEELLKLYKEAEGFFDYGFNKILFDEFYINGNRINYENEYFAKRKCLTVRAVHSIVCGDKNGDTKLCKIINAVCGEPVWALPAHVGRDTKNPEKVIDLFSAETAQTLSEILYYVSLDKSVKDTIHSLLFDRIITPYENSVFPWENANHNWAAVCGACVGMVYIYEFPERFGKVKNRILKTMNSFLSGYGNDGACLEGLDYWNYGFGYFVYFAELLRRFDGTDLFSDSKVRAIAEFNQHMFIGSGVCVSFSDSSRAGGFNIGLAYFLKKEYGDIKIPDTSRKDLDNCYRFAPYLRSFLWLDEGLKNSEGDMYGEKYFSDAQWYINKQKHFVFAAKGGNNGEPHNHNDIGSFIIASGNNQLITDFGAGEYTRDYFNDETRYDIFCVSSKGHSVPIVEEKHQKNGGEYRAEVLKSDNNTFKLDISGAYDIIQLKSLIREFKISENKILLRDVFEFSGTEAAERLVSLTEPELANGDIKIENMTIHSKNLPDIKKVTVKNHEGYDETLYCIDYLVNSDVFECEFIF